MTWGGTSIFKIVYFGCDTFRDSTNIANLYISVIQLTKNYEKKKNEQCLFTAIVKNWTINICKFIRYFWKRGVLSYIFKTKQCRIRLSEFFPIKIVCIFTPTKYSQYFLIHCMWDINVLKNASLCFQLITLLLQ